MAVTNAPIPGLDTAGGAKTRSAESPVLRILVFIGKRLLSSFIAIVIAVYLTILVANLGGHMDEIRKAMIYEGVNMWVSQDEEFRHLSGVEKRQLIEEFAAIQIQQLNLDEPFPIRSVRYLWNGLTLNLGRAESITSDSGSRQIQLILLGRLGPTLLLQASSFLLIFGSSLLLGLALSRGYGSFFDRVVVALAPASSAPAWFYGIFLILIFSALLGWLPFGGMVKAPPPPNKWEYFVSLMRHLTLPLAATFISAIFSAVFSNRTFFLIYSSEDYVDVAKAKGLSDRAIERRYVLRPTIPVIITNFALSLIVLWMGSTVTEIIFNWPGLGQLLYQAAVLPDTPVIVASTIIYAYLLAVTVFVLDVIYALVDPRVKVGAEAHTS